MTAVAFDALKLARALRDDMATKSDIQRLETELKLLEQRMTIKLGGMMVLAVGTVAVLVKLL